MVQNLCLHRHQHFHFLAGEAKIRRRSGHHAMMTHISWGYYNYIKGHALSVGVASRGTQFAKFDDVPEKYRKTRKSKLQTSQNIIRIHHLDNFGRLTPARFLLPSSIQSTGNCAVLTFSRVSKFKIQAVNFQTLGSNEMIHVPLLMVSNENMFINQLSSWLLVASCFLPIKTSLSSLQRILPPQQIQG